MISVLPFKGSYNIKNKNEIKSQEKKLLATNKQNHSI